MALPGENYIWLKMLVVILIVPKHPAAEQRGAEEEEGLRGSRVPPLQDNRRRVTGERRRSIWFRELGLWRGAGPMATGFSVKYPRLDAVRWIQIGRLTIAYQQVAPPSSEP
jgi:hypothetical protein